MSFLKDFENIAILNLMFPMYLYNPTLSWYVRLHSFSVTAYRQLLVWIHYLKNNIVVYDDRVCQRILYIVFLRIKSSIYITKLHGYINCVINYTNYIIFWSNLLPTRCIHSYNLQFHLHLYTANIVFLLYIIYFEVIPFNLLVQRSYSFFLSTHCSKILI